MEHHTIVLPQKNNESELSRAARKGAIAGAAILTVATLGAPLVEHYIIKPIQGVEKATSPTPFDIALNNELTAIKNGQAVKIIPGTFSLTGEHGAVFDGKNPLVIEVGDQTDLVFNNYTNDLDIGTADPELVSQTAARISGAAIDPKECVEVTMNVKNGSFYTVSGNTPIAVGLVNPVSN